MATLLSVNFDNHAVGPYTIAMQQADWGADVYQSSGIQEGFVSVVELFGSKWLKNTYPSGQSGQTPAGGMSWQSKFPAQSECYLSYDMYVEPDFDPVLNGKIPGLAGRGVNAGAPAGCIPVTGTNGWSCRQNFWYGEASPDYGLSAYSYHILKPVECGDPDPYVLGSTAGNVVRITQWVRMNTTGQANGEIRAWVDDKMVLDRGDFEFVSDATQIDTVFWVNFYGGDGAEYAPAKDEYFYFNNVTVTTELPITLPDFKLIGTQGNHPVSDGMRDVVLLTENAGFLPGVISYGGKEQGFATWEDDKITISQLDASGLPFGQHSFTVSKPTAAP